jgi:UDP-3-O-[3-hydroxymyristoyl] glucosamine N-acyltransferase
MKTSEIAELVGGELRGPGYVEITSCAGIDRASAGQIAFSESSSLPEPIDASCILAPEGTELSTGTPVILVARPKLAFARVAAVLHPPKQRDPQIHPTAVISSSATIGKNVFIGAFTCVGDNSRIGDGTQLRAGAKVGDGVSVGSGCVLHPNVFVEDGCRLGDRVILHSGVVVGADGFGYVRTGTAFTSNSLRSGRSS